MKPSQVFRQIGASIDDDIKTRGNQYSKSNKSRVPVQPYVRNTALSDSLLSTAETVLTVDNQDAFSFVIDDLDEIQSNVQLADEFMEDSVTDLSNVIDSEFNYTAALLAANVVDDGDIGGTAGNPIQLNGSNVFQVLSTGKRKLASRAINTNEVCGAFDPYFIQVIEEQVAARETSFGDEATKNGITYSGRMFMYNGVKMYETLNYTSTEVLGLATNPTDGDTLTITLNNVFEDTPRVLTITFVDTIGTTPGNVHIEASADLTRANLEALLNNPNATTAGYVGWADEDYWAARKLVATNDNTANTLTVRLKGGDFVAVADTLTDVTDGWSATLRCRNLYMTKPGATHTVVQKEPHLVTEKVQGMFAYRLHGYCLHGHQTFEEDRKKIVRFDIAIT
jgi:hypothetical protein